MVKIDNIFLIYFQNFKRKKSLHLHLIRKKKFFFIQLVANIFLKKL